jgi:hypothetical protein
MKHLTTSRKGKGMKIRFLVLTAVLFGNAFAVTDFKVSPQFSFLDATGIQAASVGSAVSAACNYHVSKTGSVTISWSADVKDNATLTIYSVSGAMVQVFPIKQAAGSLVWNASAKKIARGIYFAKFSFGTSLKNLKIVLH